MSDIYCIECGSTHVIKAGRRIKRVGYYQAYQCRDCGRVWTGELLAKHIDHTGHTGNTI